MNRADIKLNETMVVINADEAYYFGADKVNVICDVVDCRLTQAGYVYTIQAVGGAWRVQDIQAHEFHEYRG